MLRVGLHVELPKKLHRLEVFAPAVLVGEPLPFLPRIIEIQHRRHRVDAQSVDVILVEPEERAAQQKRAHLVAAVVEDERAPVAVLPLPGIFVLVQRRAVEARKAVRVFRKMSRHPVENHADAVDVARVDERLEIFRRPEAAGRREEAGHLIAPRPGERMLEHGQQLDVRVSHLLDVRDNLLGHLTVRERPAAPLGHALPRTEVQLVDRQRAIEPAVLARPLVHPFRVAPCVADRDPRRSPRRWRRTRRTCRRDLFSAAGRRRRARRSRTCTARRRRPSARTFPRCR